MTGGVWPAELSTVTAETAPLVKYLKADLHRIVTSANEELKKIRCAGLVESERRAQEARVIDDARAFAVRRVESSVRHLRNRTTKSPAPLPTANRNAEADTSPRFQLAPPQPDIPDTPETPTSTTDFELAEVSGGRGPAPAVDAPYQDSTPAQPEESGEVEAYRPTHATATSDPFDSDETMEIETPASPDYPEADEPAAPDVRISTASTDSDETTEMSTPSSLDYRQAAEPSAEDRQGYAAALDSDETTEIATPASPDYPQADEPAAPDVRISIDPTDSDETTEMSTPSSLDYRQAAEPSAEDRQGYAAALDSDETIEIATPASPDYPEDAAPSTEDRQGYAAAPDSDETTEIEVPRSLDPIESVAPPVRDTNTDRAAAPESSLAPDDTQALEEIANLVQEFSAALSLPPPEPPQPANPLPPEPILAPPRPTPVDLEPPRDDARAARHAILPPPSETPVERLQRLMLFVARQEPGLYWAAGIRHDGTTLLVTDFAHGWIPPGINLPADVHLLEPGRRYGTVDALLGQTEASAIYAPGDPLGWSADDAITTTSPQPRGLPAVDDLGWVLSDATHWRDGLPRMVSTLAKAAARGMGVAGPELDVLRSYLDTARYQVFAQYPAVDAGLLLNCQLLAATEGLAGNEWLTANYHLAWFLKLSSSER
ncbi:DUF5631 domain-containing protein [Mycobacterium sp.]|uniref:DUF5631 domain-containing protein n=1 Tax=Mycobacterium sp. TaxID=1785 RepID=UPI003D0E7213